MRTRGEGLTTVYRRFNDATESGVDILRLRSLHAEMDLAVAQTYGWPELELEHDFRETKQGLRFTISDRARQEVLARLLRLNHDRYADEVRQGLHNLKRRQTPREAETDPGTLFDVSDRAGG